MDNPYPILQHNITNYTNMPMSTYKSKSKAYRLTSSIASTFSSSKRRDSAGTQKECSTIASDDDASSTVWMSQSNRRSRRVEYDCVEGLEAFCKSEDISFSEEMIYRFAAFHSFNFESTQEAIDENRTNHYLNLKISRSLERQFRKCMVVPLPDLKTRKGNSDVLYLRPSRYVPGGGSSNTMPTIVETICYALNDMSNTKEKCLNGIAVVANMNEYEENNFDNDYWLQVIQILDGNLVPTRVSMLLLVNPPSWFQSKVWKQVTKPMLTESFVKRVHLVQSEKLGAYLMEGYEEFLPDDLGWKKTEEVVEDFVDLKAFQEARNIKSRS